jgi:beta-1,4-N-acetylglucosaminyltransferase
MNYFPAQLVTNGPGTAIPLCYSLTLSKLLLINLRSKLIFIESFCRTQTLSLTGKLLLPVAHLFIVQWQSLHYKYPSKTKYLGRIL